MNITPVTKKYTNLYNACSINFTNKSNVLKDSEKSFSCLKTSVKNTLNEFSNSRGNCLADIDLCDIYISNKKDALVKSSAIKKENKNINFLADMDLADSYELPKKQFKMNKNLQIPFNGAYPQYLIDQDAVEQYESTTNGIQDIAQSTYCSFSGLRKEETLIDMFVGFVKRCLPL